MLLNTAGLLRQAKTFPYGVPSSINANGSAGMPIEFTEKMGIYDFQQPQVAILDNATLAGPICVCFWQDDIVLDVAYFGRMDTWDRNRLYFNQAVESKRRFRPMQIERACSLLGVWSGNYFHWTLEVLPMVEGLLHILDDVVFLVEHQPKPWVMESLREIGVTNILPIQDMHYEITRLYVPTARRRDGRTSPDSIAFLQKVAADIAPAAGFSKIYISRQDAQKRQITNEGEVIKFLAGQGFTPVVFSDMSWKDQVSIAKGASTVVAPHGAGLVNLVYNDRQPTIIELATPEYLNPCFYTLAAALGSKHKLLVGQPEPGENIQIDLDQLGKELQ